MSLLTGHLPAHSSRGEVPSWVEPAGRAGWVARALVYGVLGVLIWQIPGAGGQEASSTGAISRVAGQPFGTPLLIALALGLAAFSLWRVTELVVAGGPEELHDKLAHAFSALVYAGLAVAAITQIGSGGSEGGNESAKAQQVTGTVFDWPAGRWLVAAVGLVAMGVGLYKAHQGLTQRFLDELDDVKMGSTARSVVSWLGTIGVTARGVVFLAVGGFLIQAALTHDPQKAKGLDESLRSVADSTLGTPFLLAVGAGLVVYAAYCLAESRYRKIPG